MLDSSRAHQYSTSWRKRAFKISIPYFPFGGGPRSCIGSGFVSVEMQLVVAMVAQRYHLTLEPGCRVHLDPGLTLRPRPGVPYVSASRGRVTGIAKRQAGSRHLLPLRLIAQSQSSRQ